MLRRLTAMLTVMMPAVAKAQATRAPESEDQVLVAVRPIGLPAVARNA
jgi:hypothetical protein